MLLLMLYYLCCLTSFTCVAGSLRPGQVERSRSFAEGRHSDRESGDGDGALVSYWSRGPATGRCQTHSGDTAQRWHQSQCRHAQTCTDNEITLWAELPGTMRQK